MFLRKWAAVWTLIGSLGLLLGAAAAKEEGPPLPLQRLRPGMTQEQVRKLLGSPKWTARQILYQRTVEQWIYEQPNPVRLEFDCQRGQPGRLLPLRPFPPSQP